MHPAGPLFGEDAVDKAVSRHTAHAGKTGRAQPDLEMGFPALAPAAVTGMLWLTSRTSISRGESACLSLPAMVSAMVMCYLLRGGFVCLPAAGVYDGRCYETPLKTRGQDPRQ